MSENRAVELVLYKAVEGTGEDDFLEASDAMMSDLMGLSGFIDRELAKNEDGYWLDIVHWNSLEEAQQAANDALNIPSCLAFFEMIDDADMKMMHFEGIRTYNK